MVPLTADSGGVRLVSFTISLHYILRAYGPILYARFRQHYSDWTQRREGNGHGTEKPVPERPCEIKTCCRRASRGQYNRQHLRCRISKNLSNAFHQHFQTAEEAKRLTARAPLTTARVSIGETFHARSYSLPILCNNEVILSFASSPTLQTVL